jgi:hypothetical protein
MKDIQKYTCENSRLALKTLLSFDRPDNPVIIVGSLGLIIHGALERNIGDLDVLSKYALPIKKDISNEVNYPPGVFDNITKRNKLLINGISICNFISEKDINIEEYEKIDILINSEIFTVNVQKLHILIKYKKQLAGYCYQRRSLEHSSDLIIVKKYLSNQKPLTSIL